MPAKGNSQVSSEGAVTRGDRLRVSAKTWNDIQQIVRDAKRKKGIVGDKGVEYTTDPQLTVLVKNASGSLVNAFRALHFTDIPVNPANNGYRFNMRPVFTGNIPDNIDNYVGVTLSAIDEDRINKCVVKGICVCKVKINDAAHDWANPVAGQTYLQSATSGIARILWYGIPTDVHGSGESGFQSGDASDSVDLEADVYYAVIDLIQSKRPTSLICADYSTLVYPFPNNGGYLGAMPRYGDVPQQTGDDNDAVYWDYDSSGMVINPTDMQQTGAQRAVLNGKVGAWENLTSAQLQNKFFNQTLCIEGGSGLYDIRASITMLHRIYQTTEAFNFSTYARLVFVNADGVKIDYVDGYGNTFGDYVYYDPPGSAEPLIVYRGLTNWVKVVSGRFDELVFTGDVWIQDRDFLGQTPPRIPVMGGWMAQCPAQERLLLAGAEDVRIAWEVDIRWVMDNRVASLMQLMDALPYNWGYGGTYLIAQPVEKMDCDSCYREPESGGSSGVSGDSVSESGITLDTCCTDVLAAHPNLTGGGWIFAWQVDHYQAVTDDAPAEKIDLICADGFWTASNHSDHSRYTIGADVSCDPFSVDIDTGVILDVDHGVITITIA